MDTDKLIDSLVEEGAKKPLLHPVKQTLLWLVGTVLYLVAFSAYNGFREDVAVKLGETLYVFEATLLFGIATSAAIVAFCLSRPDGYQIKRLKYVPFGFLFIWVVVAFAGSMGEISWHGLFHSMTLGQLDCPWHILLFSLPPGIATFLIIRSGAPTQFFFAGSMIALSVTSFGYLCMRLIEQNDNPVHLIVWHALPIFLMCLVGMIAGRFVLRWK